MHCSNYFPKRPLIILSLSVVLLAGWLSTGCGTKEVANDRPAASGEAPTNANGEVLVLDPEQLGINGLLNHDNPIVSNNAKRVAESFEAYNYLDATVGLRTIIGLKLSPQDRQTVIKAMQKLKEVATAAANNGEENAKTALENLESN